MFIERPAAEIDPSLAMRSSSATLPGPSRPSWSKSMRMLRRGIVPRSSLSAAGLLDSHIASQALSARVIAGGEGGDPRLRGEGEVGCGVCERKHRFSTKHHLTLPLLRNGPHPLPRCAAERDSERDV